MKFLIQASIICLAASSSAVAYDSREVGSTAGKYIGMAVAIDYFFDKTPCPNLMFGMRTKNRRMQDFVIEDINKLLSPSDRIAFRRIKEPGIIKNMQRDGGEAFLRIYNSKKRANAKTACRDTQNFMMGYLSSGIAEFYKAARR